MVDEQKGEDEDIINDPNVQEQLGEIHELCSGWPNFDVFGDVDLEKWINEQFDKEELQERSNAIASNP